MKLSNVLIGCIFVLSFTYGDGTSSYDYVKSAECEIPVKTNRLRPEKISAPRSSYSYIQKDWDGAFDTFPISLTIDNSEIVKSETIEKMLNNKYRSLQNTVHKGGYTIYSSEYHYGKQNKPKVRVLELGKTVVFAINYGDDEIDYLVDYCSKHKID
jgi:hypothetical protein